MMEVATADWVGLERVLVLACPFIVTYVPL